MKRIGISLLAVIVMAAQATPRVEAQTTDPVIQLSPVVGPPTTSVTVQGSGFGAESVVVYFDDDRLAIVPTESGSFRALVDVPASATPGFHAMKAVGTRSGNTTPPVSFKVQTDWRQFGYNAGHSGYNPHENVIGPLNAANLKEEWIKALPGAPPDDDPNPSSPVVVDDLLHFTWTGYTPDAPRAGAFKVASGTTVWTLDLPLGPAVAYVGDATPAVVDGRLYVTPYYEVDPPDWQASLFARNPANGAAQWDVVTADGGGNLWSPTVGGGRVYLGTFEGSGDPSGFLQARDAATGQLSWKIYLGQYPLGPAAYAGGWVYVIGTSDFGGPSTLHGIHEPEGLPLWTYDFSFPVSSPVVVGGRVYVVGNGILWAIDSVSGSLLWQSPDLSLRALPAVAYGKVYVGATQGQMYAFDRVTGALAWSGELPFQLSDSLDDMQPVIANHVVWVGCGIGDEGLVTAFNADTGDVVFYALTDTAPRGAAVANGRVFYSTKGGKVYAYGLP